MGGQIFVLHYHYYNLNKNPFLLNLQLFKNNPVKINAS